MNTKLLLDRIHAEERLYSLIDTEEQVDLLRLADILEEEADAKQRDLDDLRFGQRVYSALVAQGIETKEQLAEAYYAAAMQEAKKDRHNLEIIDLLEEGMRLGSKKARFELAHALLYGTYGNPTSKGEALGYLQEEADKNDPEALYLLSCLSADFPDLVDGPLAYQLCQKAASMGYSPAIVRLRQPFDAKPYVEILKEQAEKGDAHAYFLLSTREELGEEATTDYFQKAIDLGDKMALYLYGDALIKNGSFDEGMDHLRKAMEEGSPEACTLISEQLAIRAGVPSFYEDGAKQSNAVTIHQEQFKCYEKAAELGDLPALGRIACAYYLGYPVERNLALAGKYAKEGVERGDRFLCPFVLAAVLEEDESASGKESVELYRLAAENGNLTACSILANIYQEGLKEVEPDEKLARRYLFLSRNEAD